MEQREKFITLAHGSGGRAMHRLIEQIFKTKFDNPLLNQGDDAAEFQTPSGPGLAVTTDSYVVRPLFFPGGDIGRLSVCGTVNDLAMKAARPLYLTASFIIGEGLSWENLEKIVDSMARAAAEAKVNIVAGDTKVVERTACDGVFITTSGVGLIETKDVSGANIFPGDLILVSGTMGDHGMAVMNARGDFGLGGDIKSDVAPLWELVEAMLEVGGIKAMRDPTRGGLATTLNEWAQQSRVQITIEEEAVPVWDAVRAGAEMLGLDPLYLANEGKLVAAVRPELAGKVLEIMKRHRYGKEARIIGEVLDGPPGVMLKTSIGSHRPLLMLEGEHLPRIC